MAAATVAAPALELFQGHSSVRRAQPGMSLVPRFAQFMELTRRLQLECGACQDF